MSVKPAYQTVLAIALGLLLTVPTFAAETATQPARQRPPGLGGPGGPGAGGMLLERVQEIVRDLGLSDEQKSKVEAILAEARKDFQQMRSELQNLEPQDRMRQVGQFLDGVRMDLKNVLTPEQKAAFDKRIEEGRQQLRQRFGGQGATTRPSRAPGGQGEARGPAMMAERLRENLAKLDLSDDQKTRLKALFDEMKSKGEALREKAQSGDESAREGIRALMQETREQLKSILTPEQSEKLRESMGPPPGGPRGREGEPGGPRPEGPGPGRQRNQPPKEKADTDSQMQMMDEMKPTAKSETAEVVADKPLPAGPSPGEPAPNLSLKKLDGSVVQLSALKGRVVVFVFGSYTSPAFRQRVASLEKLENDTAGKAQFFVVYTREAHAAGEWEVDRNKSEQISVKQAADAEQRAQAARTARQALDITVPIVIDTMDDQARLAYGAGANSAYVIARDGTLAARQQWLEPTALKRAIEQAVNSPPTTRPG